MTKSIVSHLPVTKHIKKIGTHVKKHHKKYLWSAVGLFGLFKLFAFLLMGISGYMVTHATVPPIPTMATEPPYTTGTTNNVGIFGGLGASNIEYLFCKLTTNNVSGCILSQSVSQRSSTPNTTFTGLTNGQIYYYFVRARDSITTGDMSDWSASTHSTQDSTPPVTTIIAPASGSIQTGNFEVRFFDTDTLSLGPCAYKIEDNETETLGWTIRTCNTDILINQSAYCSHQGINTCVVYGVALDSAGNTGNVASRSFTIDTTPGDTTPPVITQVTPVPSPTNDTTPNYTFHSTEVGTITYGGSCSPFLDVNAVTGNNTITFNTLANGTYSDCTIEVKDAAGNVSNTLQVNTFTIDTIKPTCTSFTYNPASGPVNTNVTATCNASESVTYQSPSGTGVYTFTTNGIYVFNFTDLAGNTGSATATVTWIDKTAPVLAQVTAVPSPTNDTTPNYTFSSTEAGTITYGGSCTSATTTASIGNTTITFNTLPAGTYSNCTIVVTDSAGNQSNILAVNTFIVNTDTPSITINNPGTSPAQSKTITASVNTGTLTMTVGSTNTTCDASRTFGAYASTTFTTEADNGKYVCYRVVDTLGNTGYALSNAIGGIDTTPPTCSLAYNPALATNQNVIATCTASETVSFQNPIGTNVYTFIYNGSYVFNFTDLAGNTGSATATVTWIDKTAPVLAQITAVPSPTNDTTPNYTFSSTEAGTITYGGSCTSATTTASIGNTTITFSTLSTGTYSNCTIVVTDSAGNQSNILAVNTFIVDTSLPTAPNLFALSGTDICPSLPFVIARSGSTNISSITGGSQLSGYRYEVYSNSGMVTGMVLSGTTITTGASIIVSPLPLGVYYMRVRAINTLGDMTASNTISFTLATQYCRNNRGTGIVIATPNIWLRNVDLDTVYRSDPIVIFGLSGATPISISRGTLFINNATGAGGTTGIVTSNDTIYIEMISSTSYDTTVNSYLSVLGLTGTFSLTTKKSNCVLSAAEKIVIQNIYSDLKDQYDNDLSKLADFLTIFQSMVEDESALGNSCNLEYLLGLIEEDLGFEGGIDTSDHITPNCKEYTIGYDNDQGAYYAPEMLNRYYFINRESIIRHLDYYNPGDCHINTYENNFRIPDSSDDPMRHIAPNGKIYNLIEQYGGFSANEFASSKYFDSLDSIVRYIDIRNPAKTIWNHDIDTSFTPILYVAPNGKTYKIYKTDRGYMSYKLMSVRYYTTLAQLQNYIITNNPNK